MEVFTSTEFGDIHEATVGAFSFCRDMNHPVVVMIDEHKCKVFPSGRLVDLDTGKVNDETDW